MSRAQRLALAAALAGPGLGAAGCTQTVTPVYGAPIPSEAGSSGTGAGGRQGVAGEEGVAGMAVYGAPLAGNPAPGAGSRAPEPVAGNVAVPPYGVPIAGNPSPPMDGGVEPDEDGGPVVTPVYGAPTPQE